MVVEFSVQNFRSIKDIQTISFVATGLKSPQKDSKVDSNNIRIEHGMKILKTVGIYGANGSGKSNIIKALEFFLQVIKSETSSISNLNYVCDPFLFQDEPFEKVTYFQIVLVINSKKYRYGFTVKKNPKTKKEPFENEIPNNDIIDTKYSEEIIVQEWLYGTKENNMSKIFTRSEKNVELGSGMENDKIPPIPYEHTLYLNHAAAFENESPYTTIKNYIAGWTISNFKGEEEFRYLPLSYIGKNNEDGKDSFLKLLSSFNLNYEDISYDESELKHNLIFPLDKIYVTKNYIGVDNTERKVTLNLKHHESSGTQKLFDIAGLLLRAFNLNISVFIILDEIDSNFHPSLLIKLIGLFNNPAFNKNGSQLLFTSHDTNLMDSTLMRRDQFYFTEKKTNLSTRLYSLADLKGIKNDANFARDYLKGYYGGLPILEDHLDNPTA